ncbi:Mg2+ transporter -like Zinc transport [Pyrenophora seminiperda CCB06]|uniref:Mg2+ transporter-like Zinc transport n=1 Tax=Pyrenophora seminiperda CCB06 TaxID=1302712 RepID=A0A3M7MCC2_9PLEO|nr:Mg2+ transporter -like Zinc transport [Pyrenophora seminiperda CCB06]
MELRTCTIQNDALFSRSKQSHHVQLTIIGDDTRQDPKRIIFTDHSQLSIHQKDTWAPLSVSPEMISLLADHHKLGSGFFQILSCFKDRYMPAEEGFAPAPRSFGWVYKYSEKKPVQSGTPWRIRQTGLYHVFDRERAKTVLIIISPSPTAYFLTRILELLEQPQFRSTIRTSPMLLHPMLISSHLSSWREYLEYHESLLLKLDMKSACSSLGQPLFTYETLREVREVEKKILPINPLLTALDGVIKDLEDANRNFTHAYGLNDSAFQAIQAPLNELRKEAASYRTQAVHMQKRAQSSAQSILDSLNLGFQQLAQNQNKNTLVMARSSREDSVAIRAITLVTSFYLPFSFVATMFGMNLVDFDEKSRNLIVSHQFWLYFVISVPLTVVTLLCWHYRMQAYRRSYLIGDRETMEDRKQGESSVDVEMV